MSDDYAIYVGGVRYVKGDRIEELEAENHLLKTSGIIEVAAHNNRVTEYMFHWEGRALDAEAKLAQQDDLVQAAVAAALREAADAVEDYCSDAPDLAGHGHSGAIRDVITAIRKGGE